MSTYRIMTFGLLVVAAGGTALNACLVVTSTTIADVLAHGVLVVVGAAATWSSATLWRTSR